MTGGAKMPPFTRKRKQIFMMALIAFNTCKSNMKISAIQVFINNIRNILPPKSVCPLISFLPNAFKFFKVSLHASIVLIFSRISRSVDRINIGVCIKYRHDASKYKEYILGHLLEVGIVVTLLLQPVIERCHN
jgi:hypothetical protein